MKKVKGFIQVIVAAIGWFFLFIYIWIGFVYSEWKYKRKSK